MFGAEAQLHASEEQCQSPYTCNCVCAIAGCAIIRTLSKEIETSANVRTEIFRFITASSMVVILDLAPHSGRREK
jgi:hypothetical protein